MTRGPLRFSAIHLWCKTLCAWVCVQELASEGTRNDTEWPAVYKNQYASSWWYHMRLCFMKKLKLMLRDVPYLRSQIVSSVLMGEEDPTWDDVKLPRALTYASRICRTQSAHGGIFQRRWWFS